MGMAKPPKPDATIASVVPMSPQRKGRLRSVYCRRQASYLWGDRRIITPELLPVEFGDGRQLIAVRPLNPRRSHYVVAVDSSLRVWAGDIHDVIDQVYEELETYFGHCGCEECYSEGKPWPITFKQWPIPCFNLGTEWWRLGGKEPDHA